MSILDLLSAEGFAEATIVGEKSGKVVVRVKTARGWTYERFTLAKAEAEVAAWAVMIRKREAEAENVDAP